MPDVGAGMFSAGLAATGGVGTRVGAAFVEVFADVGGLKAGFASAEGLTRSFAARMQVTGAMTARTGAFMTRNLTVPLLAIAGASAKMASDFETAMERTSALAGVAKQDLSMYREEVLALSRQTAQAPTDLANALYFVASAGLKDNQILPVLTMSAKAAAAQMADAATIGHLLTGVLVAYGDEAPTAAQAMDVLTAAIREGKAEPEDLASNLGTVIPVAAQMGVSFDELAGAIAASTNVNINAARAATGLRYMLIQLQNPTETAKNILDDYGLSAAQVQRWVEEDLITGLERLAETFDMTTAKGKEAFFTTVGGVRSGQVALALIGESYERTQHVMDVTANAMTNSKNEFIDAYNQMRETPGFELQKAWNDLKLAAIEAGTIILPVALDLVNAIADLARSFSDLPDPVQKSIIAFGAWVAAAGPVLSMFGRLWMNLGRLKLAFTGMGAAGAMGVPGMGTAGGLGTMSTGMGRWPLVPMYPGGMVTSASQRAQMTAAWAAANPGVVPPAGTMASPWPYPYGQAWARPVSATYTGPSRWGGLLPGKQIPYPVMPPPVGGMAGLPAPPPPTTGAGVLSKGAALGLGFLEQAAWVAAGAEAIGAISKAVDMLATSNEDLADETGFTIEQVEGLKGAQEGWNMALLHPFASEQDRVREAGEMVAEIYGDAKTAGMGFAETQREINAAFEASMQDIGGWTGSMDTFEQNLRARLGLLSMEDAQTLLDRRWAAAIEDNLNKATMKVEEFAGFTSQELVAAMTSVERSGLDVTSMLGTSMRDALQAQIVTWDQLISLYRRAGATLPYKEAGQFAEALFMVEDATEKQRSRLAGLIGALKGAGIEFDDTARSIIEGGINLELIGQTYQDLGSRYLPDMVEMLFETAEGMKDNQTAALAAKLAAEDYLGFLKLLDKYEARRAGRAAGVTEGGQATGAVGADIRANLALIDEFLDRKTEMKSWGRVLEDATTLPRESFVTLGNVVSTIADLGIEWKDVAKETRKEIVAKIEAGDATAAMLLLLGLAKDWERKPHKGKVEVKGAKEAKEEIANVRDESEGYVKGSPYSATVDADTGPARDEILSFKTWFEGLDFFANVGSIISGPLTGPPGRQPAPPPSDKVVETASTFYRPVRPRGRVPARVHSSAARAETEASAGSRDLHVHVQGRMDYAPADLRRNLEGWWKRRGW